MIDAAEYIQLRQRVLIAAEAAHRIAISPHQVVFYELEDYQTVLHAMVCLKADIRKLVFECQILRGANDGVAVCVMGGVPEGADHPRGAEERVLNAGPVVGVPASGPDGPGQGRPKPRRNTGRNRKPAAVVDKASRAKPVDRAG
jgi:hypothetical protein